MELKWQIYQDLFHEITLNAYEYHNNCKDLLYDTQTELGIYTMIFNFSVKFITDTFDKIHRVDPDFVEAMILALKNYMLLSDNILIEKNENRCQRLSEIIMDRIIWYYSGSNYSLADIKKK